MTQHSSLKPGRGRKRHRSVLKRFERIKILKDKREWEDGDSVFGLPKVKTIRIRVKKEKAAAEPETAPAETPTIETEATPSPPAKEKTPPKKEKEK